MSERATRQFGPRFWDGVECEVEVLDPADYALFLCADQLEIEPRAGFERALLTRLAGLCRGRWSN